MEREPDWRDKYIQEQVNKLGDQAEAIIEEKIKNDTSWFICTMPPAIVTIRPENKFEYREQNEFYRYTIKSIPGKTYHVNIFNLSQWGGWERTLRIQKADGYGWHLLVYQIKAISSGSTGSEYNEFPFDQIKDFTDLLKYLEKIKPLEIQPKDFTWSSS